jgi:hypothetical protein
MRVSSTLPADRFGLPAGTVRMTVRKWRVLGVIILVIGLAIAAHGLYRLVTTG